ncbi:MAG: hydrogenase nickel incorporation protein HypB [Anaerolineae bacterium]|nr:hydrogenase nickel incorporation protein HypB [Anaerolineae bacterium]MDW8299227.1 hydrogenase nickel incorporation protein HypB [Anaerolineae bacterium]
MSVKVISVLENILQANDQIAAENRARLDAAGVYAINLMSAPGAGKTALIEQTLRALTPQVRIGMINGDTTAASMDAERGAQAGAMAVHINTGGNCHLEAHMVRQALSALDLSTLDLLIVENVGNLVCPAGWDLGTHARVMIASVTEGDDKPYKYPSMYRAADVLILNKIDLLPYLQFNLDYYLRGVRLLKPEIQVFQVSCRTGEGISAWIDWLRECVSSKRLT